VQVALHFSVLLALQGIRKATPRNPAFISVSKSIVFLVFGCFFWVNEQRSLTLAIFSVSLRKSAHSPSGTEGERLPAMGGDCKRGGLGGKEKFSFVRRRRLPKL